MKQFFKMSVVAKGGLILAISSLLSRFLGLFRDFTFSKVFGVGEAGGFYALDAYFAAFRIPDLLYTLLIVGAMSAAFIPIYSQLLKKNSNEASLFASHVLNFLLVLMFFLAALAWIFAPFLIPLLAPGFSEEILKICIELTRIMLLSPIFLGLSSVFQGIENSHKAFYGIALAPLVYNLSIIVSAWFFAPEYGVYALAWGVVVGAFLHLLFQLPEVLRTKFRYSFSLNFRTEQMKNFMRLTVPRLFGLAATQLSTLVDTVLASLLALGSLSIFNYALNLQSLPYGVVAISLSVAVFATLSERMEDKHAFLETLKRSQHAILFWVIPAILGLFVLRKEIVDLILLGGGFDESAAEMTAFTLGIFIWAALGQSLIPLYARAFYALQVTKTPVGIGLLAVSVNMICSVLLVRFFEWEVWALAISAVLSASINAFLLFVFLKKRLNVSLSNVMDWKPFFGLLLAAGGMLVWILLLQKLSFSSEWMKVLVISFTGAILYLGLAKVMKIIPSLRES